MTEKISDTKAYYVDTFAQGSTHEMFNSSLILMCSMVFDKVECRVGKSAFNAFENVLNAEIPLNINFKRVWVIGGNGRSTLILRYLLSAIQNVIFLLLAPKNSIVIYPFNNLFGVRAVNFVNKICKKKVIIFCHNEMESMVTDIKKIGFLHRIFPWLCRNFFLNSNVKIANGVYFSVMGEIIKKNISTLISSDKISKFICIDHPYIFKEKVDQDKREADLFHIGTVGALSKIKGLDSLSEFVSAMNPVRREKIKISITGLIGGDVAFLNRLGIDTAPQNKSLSRTDFNKRIQELDLLLFFYPQDSYKITASGALMDAILHEKPILALKNDYFEYIFGKFGEFGYLLDNTDQMIDQLHSIMDQDKVQIIDFKRLKDKFSPETISLQLSDELSRIGYLNK